LFYELPANHRRQNFHYLYLYLPTYDTYCMNDHSTTAFFLTRTCILRQQVEP
jgi:hypothetical protein